MLKFRNLEVSPQDPVDTWGVEGLLTAIERGGADEWARVSQAVRLAGPESGLRKDLDEALSLAEGGGKNVIQLALRFASESSEEQVLRSIQSAFTMAHMTITEFAERVGTSRTRMSAYLAGKTMPSASILQRMQTIAASRRSEAVFS